MKILDYIFYRFYLYFKKSNFYRLPKLDSIISISIILFVLFRPIFNGCCKVMFEDGYIKDRYSIPFLIFVIASVSIRYIKDDKVKEILDRYSNCGVNKMIPTWLFGLLLLICLFVAFALQACFSSVDPQYQTR